MNPTAPTASVNATGCRICGHPLREDVGGLCAACLLTSALESADEPADVDASEAESDSAGILGGRIGQYELLAEIARGGMGIVYRARQQRPLREVALKMMLPLVANSDAMRQRFHREAQAAASLDHPAILPIFEVGDHDGLPYISMKLADGGSLASRVDSYAGDWRAIADVVAHLARGIAHAHARGIVHRDIKPANILFDANGTALVADFGLAKSRALDPSLTLPATVLGSPNYMAPEQVANHVGAVGPATDVYSLGAVLYELLTGKPPLSGDSAIETLRLLPTQAPESARTLNAAVPPALDAIALRCLAKDPAQRYSTADALALDLEQWLGGGPVEAADRQRTARRLRLVAITAGLLAVVAGGFAGHSLWSRSRALSNAVVVRVTTGTRNQAAAESFARGHTAYEQATVDGYRMAIAAFDGAIALDPGFAEAYAWKARSLIQLHRRYALVTREDLESSAHTAIDRALQINPSLAIGYLADGERVMTMASAPEPVALFERAIRLDPTLAAAHAALGWSYARTGRYADAEREFHLAMNLAPADAEIRARFGRLLMRTGRIDEARLAFSQAMQAAPNQPDAYLGDGELEIDAGGHLDRGARLLRRGLQIDPKNAKMAGLLINALCELGDASGVRTTIIATRSFGQQSGDWMHDVAWCQIRNHQFAAARQTIGQMELNDHAPFDAIELRAWATGRDPTAERALLDVLKMRFPDLFGSAPKVDRGSIGAAAITVWMADDLHEPALRDRVLAEARRFFEHGTDADRHVFPFHYSLVSAYGRKPDVAAAALKENLEPVPQSSWWLLTDRQVAPLCDLVCGNERYDDLARRSAEAIRVQAANLRAIPNL
jgi:Tfp pilus assembly protein PilF/tRNA A-37 threonylcarbamoyl transferase component Bud32